MEQGIDDKLCVGIGNVTSIESRTGVVGDGAGVSVGDGVWRWCWCWLVIGNVKSNITRIKQEKKEGYKIYMNEHNQYAW